MKLPISDRLLTCCRFISGNVKVADIGTDHGYLGIYLLQNNLASFVIASDINPLPLESSKKNAQKFGTESQMAFYLSDGAQNIPRDFDVMVCAGMGADTIISILEAAPWLKSNKYKLILQCQSKRPELRQYLSDNDYKIINETLVRDGRFIYTVMEVKFEKCLVLTPGECYISPALFKDKSPLLPEFRDRVMKNLLLTIHGLEHSVNQRGYEKLNYYKLAYEQLLETEDK